MATLIKENDRTYRDKQFRVIDDDGEQLGILDFHAAIAKAQKAGLDLVVVAEKSEPPVARIMDYGKLVFEQKKREKDQKKKNAAQKVKEVKFSLRISQNDFDFKLNHALQFFAKGYKVKITIQFMGRELAHKEIGYELFNRIVTMLKPYALPEGEAKLMGKTITVGFNAIRGANFDHISLVGMEEETSEEDEDLEEADEAPEDVEEKEEEQQEQN